jgi:predicted DCC family thiol-disulfide oxidoreductase YuxK
VEADVLNGKNLMNGRLKVFYDGQCPLCSREITFYQRQKGANEVDWVDVFNSSANVLPKGLTRTNALKRFYVLSPDGNLVSGGNGFVLLWLALPKFSVLGKIFNNKLMGFILECFYKFFVFNRPGIQSLFHFITKLKNRP